MVREFRNKKSPVCPYCLDGYIVSDNATGDLFCDRCFREVEINGFTRGQASEGHKRRVL